MKFLGTKGKDKSTVNSLREKKKLYVWVPVIKSSKTDDPVPCTKLQRIRGTEEDL
jgi:hypothetical protein